MYLRHYVAFRFVFRQLFLPFLLAAIFTIMAMPVHAEPAAPGSISGTVRNADGIPLAGIRVRVISADYYSSTWRTVVTGVDGTYRVAVLPAGTYWVEFSDPAHVYARQYYPNSPGVQGATDLIIAGQNFTDIDTTLPTAGGISGTLFYTGTAVSESRYVYLYANVGGIWSTVTSTYTLSSGAYQFPELRPGIYRVCTESIAYNLPDEIYYLPIAVISYVRFQSCYDRISGGVANATDVPVAAGQVTAGIDLHPGQETDLAIVRGTVTDESGSPLPEMVVDVSPALNNQYTGRSAPTDAQGAYTVTQLAPGNYLVRFRDPAGLYATEYFTDAAIQEGALSLTLGPGEVRSAVDASLTAGGRITGTVKLLGEVPPTNTTLTAVALSSDPFFPKRSSLVRPDPLTGAFTLGGLRPGAYQIALDSYELPFMAEYVYYAAPSGVTTSAQAATTITVTPGSTIAPLNIILGVGRYDGVIAGTVTGESGPAAGIRATLYRAYYYFLIDVEPLVYTFTDANGKYRFEGLVPGEYYVQFTDPTDYYGAMYYSEGMSIYEAQRVFVNQAQSVSGIDAQLRRAGGIAGAVSQSGQTPMADVTVNLYGNSLYWGYIRLASTRTDALGAYRFAGLLPGAYRVCVDALQGVRCYGDLSPYDDAPSLPIEVVSGKETRNVDVPFVEPLPIYLPVIGRQ